MLSQLVYVSNRKSTSNQQEIDDIVEACKRNNPALGITGVLLYNEDKFIQLVEGDAKTLNALYDKIKADDRHEKCRMISYMPIKEKAFPSWHMATKELASNQLNYKTVITVEDRKFFDSVLLGKELEGERVLDLLKKFFNN